MTLIAVFFIKSLYKCYLRYPYLDIVVIKCFISYHQGMFRILVCTNYFDHLRLPFEIYLKVLNPQNNCALSRCEISFHRREHDLIIFAFILNDA
jgi:hypothetical protein